jgi:hypothetical protein
MGGCSLLLGIFDFLTSQWWDAGLSGVGGFVDRVPMRSLRERMGTLNYRSYAVVRAAPARACGSMVRSYLLVRQQWRTLIETYRSAEGYKRRLRTSYQ